MYVLNGSLGLLLSYSLLSVLHQVQSARIDSVHYSKICSVVVYNPNSSISCINTTVFEPIGLRAPVLDRSESRLYVIPHATSAPNSNLLRRGLLPLIDAKADHF